MMKSTTKTTFATTGDPLSSETTNFKKTGAFKTFSLTSFASALFDEDHEIEGGSIQTSVWTDTAHSMMKSTTKTTFATTGDPLSSETTNFKKTGAFKTFSLTSFASALFDEDHEIEGGSIQTSVWTDTAHSMMKSTTKTTFATTGDPSMSETTNFKKTGAFKTFSLTSFSSALFCGDQKYQNGSIQTSVWTDTAHTKMKSTTKTTFATTGDPSSSETTNFKKTGAFKTFSLTSFASALFDEGHEIEGGSIQTSVWTDTAHSMMKSTTKTTFATTGDPSMSETTNFKKTGAFKTFSLTSFASALFDEYHEIEGGSIQTSVWTDTAHTK